MLLASTALVLLRGGRRCTAAGSFAMVMLAAQPMHRLPTGVVGFDQITRGGLFRGELYLIAGPAGAGKTTLASQICFSHVAAGGRAVYLTLLTENHSRLLAHLATYRFFDATVVGQRLHYFSASSTLDDNGLDGLFALIRQTVREQQATLLVVDTFENVRDYQTDALSYKRLFQQLQAFSEATGCAMLLLSRPQLPGAPEYTLVDGIVVLQNRHHGLRSVRTLEVEKLRGSGVLEGHHVFNITADGLEVYPRTESLLATPSAMPVPTGQRLSSGVPQFDAMLGGGIPHGSSTLLLGTPGSGKTALAIHFLAAGIQAGQTGVYLGVNEPPPRLLAKAQQIGRDLAPAVDAGQVAVLWHSPVDVILDAYAARVLAVVQELGARRLVLDGLIGLAGAADVERLGDVVAALFGELQARGVTTYVALELGQLFGPQIDLPLPRVAARLDNLFLLRAVELRAQLYRLLSIQKMRDSAFDPAIREFRITSRGIDVALTFESAEAILSGLARPVVVSEPITGTRPSRKGAGTHDHDPDR